MNKIPHLLTGISGEYFVAGELSRKGYIALLTLKSTAGVDILVSNPENAKTINIQVKTAWKESREWLLN